MENFVVQQNANIIDIKGMVSTNSNIDIQLNIGDEITPATMILLSEGSEIVLAFDDGSQQKITYKLDNSESPLTVENLLGDNVINPEEIINTANQSITSIEDIQALIESGEDIELPDTAAGLTLSNGGFSFNRLDRIADETLAQAGYDTTGFDSTFLPPTQPDPLNNAATFAGVPSSDLVDANEVVTTAEDTNVSGNLLTNASSADGTPVITEFTIGGTVFTVDPAGTGTTATLAEGELTINPDGSYTFVPAPDYNGAVPEVVYTISDGVNTDTSTLNISVTPSVNLPPLAENDTFAVNEGETVSGNVISHNDGDGVVDSDGGDGATLTITQVNGANLVFDPSDDGYATIAIQDGILRINAQGDFSYNNSGFTLGSISPSFNYTLSDGSDTDTATVIINVVDTAPIAFADNNYIKLNENTDGNARFSRVKGNVLSLGSSGDVDDTSADGTVTLVKVTYGGIDYVFDAINTSFTIEADFGTFTINNTGYYLYATKDGMDMPLTNVRDTLSYTIQDGDTIKPETDTTTLTINISVPNAAPTPVVAPLFFNDINDVSEISLNKSSTIDTSTLQKVSAIDISNLPENGPINSSDTDAIDFNLDDFIGETSTHSIDQLLSFNNDEKTVDSTRENNTFEISKEQIVLEKDTLALNQQITNGLLNEGATIISDNSAPSTVPHIELDSNELL